LLELYEKQQQTVNFHSDASEAIAAIALCKATFASNLEGKELEEVAASSPVPCLGDRGGLPGR
jgi:hypothetical protein